MTFKVKEFREKCNMTQLELCNKANVSHQTFIDLESGKDVNTTIATLQRLVEVLKCKVGDLVCS